MRKLFALQARIHEGGGDKVFTLGDERDRLAITIGSRQRGNAVAIAQAIASLCTTLGAQR